jgi:hypothetical protein
MKKLPRRTVLRGAGGVALSLPLLEAMGATSKRQTVSGVPQRILFFQTEQGSIPENLWPQGGETGFALSPILMPLEPYQSRLLVLKGIDDRAANAIPGDGHAMARLCRLTGRSSNGEVPGGISIDQAIADAIGSGLPFKSIECGVGHFYEPGGFSYSEAGDVVPYEREPDRLYQRLFMDFSVPSDPAALARLLAERKSVLDAVQANFGVLSRRLGKADKDRLNAHATQLREMEQRLLARRTCAKSEAPGLSAADEIRLYGQHHMDLIVQALACDLTRVASINWRIDLNFSPLNVTGDFHDLVHRDHEDVLRRDTVTRVKTWFAQQLRYLLDQLAAAREGAGSLLDNTLIVWHDEFLWGNDHSHESIPYVLVGDLGGRLRTGRFLDYAGTASTNQLFVSLLNALGQPAQTFGDPQFGSGPLPRLT